MATNPLFGARRKTGKVITLPQSSEAPLAANRRSIDRASGRALEALGHAIEYLADEYAFTTAQMGSLDSNDPRIEAIQLLMSLNRQIYYSCPPVEPATRRFLRWLCGSPQGA